MFALAGYNHYNNQAPDTITLNTVYFIDVCHVGGSCTNPALELIIGFIVCVLMHDSTSTRKLNPTYRKDIEL